MKIFIILHFACIEIVRRELRGNMFFVKVSCYFIKKKRNNTIYSGC